MKKERFKSITLIALIVLNVFLCSRILIDKKLWPHGYNFFSSAENSSVGQMFSKLIHKYSNHVLSKVHITAPGKIIVNTGYQTTRLSLDPAHEMYKDIYDSANTILTNAIGTAGKNIIQVPQDEWYSALMGKSIYLSYTTDFDTKLFAKLIGVKETELPTTVSNISNAVIAPLSSGTVNVYLQDKKEDMYYKLTVNVVNIIEEKIDFVQRNMEEVDADSSIINYSFDLLFDKAFGDQKAVLDPMIPIYSNPQSFAHIISENPISRSDGVMNQGAIDKVLKIFEINPSTVRRYTEASGTLVFVENNATLKISPDGIVDYSVKEGANGLKISDTSSAYDEICGIADLMDDLNQAVSTEKNLCVTSSLTGESLKTQGINISFDYVVNGLPVIFNMPKSNHAVNALVEGGYVKKYVHVLRSYNVTSTITQTPEYIHALDMAIAEHAVENEQIVIDKMYTAYFDNGASGEKTADWKVEVRQ